MGKKKSRQIKFKPVDVNNLPTSSTKIVKTSDDVNTSSELSVTSSKANESIDSISRHYGEISNESISDGNDDSCKSPRSTDDDHNRASENNAARGNPTRCNISEESSECITRGQHSDVTYKFQHVTIDSQTATKSDASDHTQKKYDGTRETKSYHDGGKYKNYNKKISQDFYKDDRPNQRDRYNRKNQNRGDSTYINDRNFTNKSSNNFNKSDRPNQYTNSYRRQNKYDSAKSHEYRNRNSNVWAQMPENLPLQTEHESNRNKVKSEEYNHSTSGIWKQRSSEEMPSITDIRLTKGYFLEQNDEENWDENSPNEQGTFVENETTTIKDGSSSWDNFTWNNSNSKDDSAWNTNSSKDDSDWNTNSSKDDSAWNTNSSKDDSAWNINRSKNDSTWDDDAAGTELNANAKAFVPILPGQDGLGETEYTTSDDFDYRRKSEKPFQERQQRGRLGKSQYGKTNYSEDWRTSKRDSEGSNWEKKENSKITRQSYSFDRSFEKVDEEYRKFRDEERNCDKIEFLRVVEKQQDLFAIAKEYCLAHCVAEDLRMGSGIAVSFKRDFKDLDVLLNQRQKQGGLAVLENKTDEGVRYIYYLVTKRVSNGKPTYETLWSSLKKMRDHIREQNVRKLAIPRLGCGLDRLEWTKVKHMIEFLFREVEVEIMVCNFQQTDESPEKPLNQTCKVVNVKKSVADIEEETTIIYLSSGDGHVSTEMEQLSKKFPFLDEFKRARKQLGDLVKYEVPKKFYVLYGCIVRRTEKDPFDFVSFRKCVSQIDRNSKKDGYFYVAIQAIKDDNDDLINDKLVTILRNYLHRMELYVCWDGDLVSQMPLPPPQ